MAKESLSHPARVALYGRVSRSITTKIPRSRCANCGSMQSAAAGKLPASTLIMAFLAKDYRPALNRLMADACTRKFDALLVWKLDRFGRSLRHLVNALAELEALGVAFVSLRDNLDLSAPAGRLMFQIIGAMAEFERALIQERVRAGLRNARAKGKRLGRPTVVVDRSRIASLRAQGRGWKAIARTMRLGLGTVLRAAQQGGLVR